MTIKVIGAGLGRTGTMSFKRAMDILGFGPCYHMYEVFENPKAIEFWRRAGDGDLGDLADIFSGYNSTCDWPTARWYREQAERWPDEVPFTRDGLIAYLLSEEAQLSYADAGEFPVIKDIASKVSPDMRPYMSAKLLGTSKREEMDSMMKLAGQIYKK